MKTLLWIPKCFVVLSLIGIALITILAVVGAILAASLGPSAAQELPELHVKNPASILFVLGAIYFVVSVCYSDSFEPLSGGIARLSAFVGVTALVLSFLYFQGHDVLAIVANHDFGGGATQTLPVFQGLASVAPWWLLGALVVLGIAGCSTDRTEHVGQVALLEGGAYLVMKSLIIFM